MKEKYIKIGLYVLGGWLLYVAILVKLFKVICEPRDLNLFVFGPILLLIAIVLIGQIINDVKNI